LVCSKDPSQDVHKDRPSLKQLIAHRVRELNTLSHHLCKKSCPRLIAFPCDSWKGASGNLWGSALKEMKSQGWDIVLAPGQLELVQRHRLCKLLKPDAILFLKARTWKNHPHHFPGIPLIFLIDDADFVNPVEHDHIVDCVKAAALTIAGNEYVADWCRQHNPSVQKIWVPHPPRATKPAIPNNERDNIIMWAPREPATYPNEAQYIAQVITKLRQTRSDFEFWMTGCTDQAWSDAYAKPLLDLGVRVEQFGYFKDYADYLATIARCPIGLHPVLIENEYAKGKSFGKILSYIATDTAVVTDHVPDHADFFKHQHNGMLADSAQGYVDSINHLLDHPEDRARMAEQAYGDFLDQLATPIAAKALDQSIRHAINHTIGSP